MHSDNYEQFYTKQDIEALENGIDMLSQRNKELNELLALLDGDSVTTFENEKYTNDVRETIMALLSLNVSMTKVSEVVRIVLDKLAKKGGGRGGRPASKFWNSFPNSIGSQTHCRS